MPEFLPAPWRLRLRGSKFMLYWSGGRERGGAELCTADPTLAERFVSRAAAERARLYLSAWCACSIMP